MTRVDVTPAVEFLRVPTPDAWLASAVERVPELLIDHANCEKKAASTALALTYRYVADTQLLRVMSRLAREELRHFEQVVDLLEQLEIPYVQLSASRYAGELQKLIRRNEPERLVDTLVMGAVVEARSCERFVRLVDCLPPELAGLYRQLVHSEARHFLDYLALAEARGGAEAVAARVAVFLDADASLVTQDDDLFRFHSGVPKQSTPA